MILATAVYYNDTIVPIDYTGKICIYPAQERKITLNAEIEPAMLTPGQEADLHIELTVDPPLGTAHELTIEADLNVQDKTAKILTVKTTLPPDEKTYDRWYTVTIPDLHLPPGKYTGTIKVTAKIGKTQLQTQKQLTYLPK